MEANLIPRFTGPSAPYYTRAFAAIQSRSGFVLSFNPAAAILGPIWAGMRGMSFLFLLLCFLDLLALNQIVSGLGGNTNSAEAARISQLQDTIATRRAEATEAIAAGDTDTATRAAKLADNLQKAVDAAMAETASLTDGASTRVVQGVILLLVIRLATGFFANAIYERRYTAWRGDQTLPHGAPPLRGAVTLALASLIYGVTLYARIGMPPDWLTTFPADKTLFSDTAAWFDAGFEAAYASGQGFFDGLRNSIRILVEGLEIVLVGTPWPVIMLVICTLAWQLAGPRIAVFTAAALAYLAFYGFWELSMQTVALLGAASILCIVIGIPLGIWFARSKTAFAIAQPILDFMQTMPAFVYLIPVIAFFGTGKPPGIIATLIFGMPPVIRLTTLGLTGVAEDVKEAARAYGATEWQVLRGVELPLAKASILAGINQTILMCLSMVVIASLIGAQGLGSVVLTSLQYAAKGQGLLAGLAILLCAMVIDRIVQGSFRKRE
ncbi:glycine betaine transport system permease protein OpuAB [Roseovarius mucosus]|uniref:Glycine betaine transport system permease protein OpuAB n=1 Tax=Roseovarius mucosus TaxID=215743 RepID=A0A1V0RMU6_9RHOB|nr:ABC transporter permease subunit [Roseovarius mucosus]ARE83098.1 glycine betaine transport system permease protein OpuAB [Roseovarius mucosus]